MRTSCADSEAVIPLFTRSERVRVGHVLRDAESTGFVTPRMLGPLFAGTGRDAAIRQLGESMRRRLARRVSQRRPAVGNLSAQVDRTADNSVTRRLLSVLGTRFIKDGVLSASVVHAAVRGGFASLATLLASGVDTYTTSVGRLMANAFGYTGPLPELPAYATMFACLVLRGDDGEHKLDVIVESRREPGVGTFVDAALLPHMPLINDALTHIQLHSVALLRPNDVALGEPLNTYFFDDISHYTDSAFAADGSFVITDDMTQHFDQEYGLTLGDPDEATRIERLLRFMRECGRERRYSKSAQPGPALRRSASKEPNERAARALTMLGRAVAWSASRRKIRGVEVSGLDEDEGWHPFHPFYADLSGWEERSLSDVSDHFMNTGASCAARIHTTDPFDAFALAVEESWCITLLDLALSGDSQR
ncbi:MAG: hypothetical protein ACREPQ_14500 [Rhodanobacter sp.]